MERLKQAVFSWPSTIAGLGILAFLAFAVHRDASLLHKPELLIGIALGLLGIFTKTSESK